MTATIAEPKVERFWAKVDKDGPNGCWVWTGARDKRNYGLVNRREWDTVLAHRISYSLVVGEIPEELTLDHLCRNTSCVNPDHLEPVTQRENVRRGMAPAGINARKTECDYGHPYDDANTWWDKRGNRVCKICNNRRKQEWRRRVRARGGKPA